MTALRAISLDDFLCRLPKAELHCHLLGTVRRATFSALARRERAPVSEAEIEAFYTRGEKPVGVLRVLRALEAWLLKTPADLHRITLEYLEDAAAHGVRYSEFFWNPTGTLRATGISYRAAQDAIVRGIRDAQAAHGIMARLVPAIDREAGPAAAREMVEWVRANRVDEVVGIGIDYRENEFPPELFIEAYADARRAGLRATAHAGEFGLPWTNVQTAIDRLQVDRIDHGYTVVDNPELTARCVQSGIVFTVVPTNSHYLRTLAPDRWALDHPIRRMHALGLRIHPNTDDPTLHHVTPTQAWGMMVRSFGLSAAELRPLMMNGLAGAWIDDSRRQRWAAEWSREFDALLARLAPDESEAIGDTKSDIKR